MNVLVSECSSGCESGWTMYLEHSMDDASHRDPPPFVEANNKRVADEVEVGDEEEEDLSMVSDASSGPPHLHEEEEEEQDQYHEGCLDNNGGRLNKLEYPVSETGRGSVPLKCKSSSKRKKKMGDHHPSFLDDTASSPLINFMPSNEFMLTNRAAPPHNFLLKHTHGFSTRDFEGTSAAQHQSGSLQPSLSSHQFQKNQRRGRKKMEFR